MDNWGIEPQPLTRPIRAALQYGCQEDHDADMELVDAYEREADDRDAARAFYNG